ncbi:hypothetical protein M2459_002730 [Parabacteroides sp. PF5-5]|uniref:T9SS type A sorting domain-containing protein n=1 Tax=unclassified Parabacteroides TaxID=2649774 RepID=UPI0024769674|nr:MULTISPECIES: T9SS type A sorting domain-containing protein [unclassified Parabacteroides]MDH6306126.1 hypothetical protein [Parabacteroides sp. PH5-39]MDH6316976.1 hypothetical protein [Parabacteroides sp. PF5-13]MDH6320729.1 hypothetical protein [Parabacteroides sp. PH5-13]MDH6324569.1 hypothetical protein [Parabacteroides sp. PH5-8]MDH6328161.1 hypothetical protein [Parabacteroides sp. PH5-41]
MNKTKIIYSLASLFLFSALPLTGQAQVALRNDGNMYVGGNASKGLYIGGGMSAYEASKITHPGVTVLTGNLTNNVTSNNVFNTASRAGTFEFRGTAGQTVLGTANKENNYIAFPNTVVINNGNDSVLIAASQAASVKTVTFTKGRLILDSESAGTDVSRTAHLMLEEGASKIANTETKSNIQVNLFLSGEGHLAAFTSPFKKIYADYFFYNFLSIPSETELFKGNSNELWNTDPTYALTAGMGYIIGQGLVPYSNTGYYSSTLNNNKWLGADLADATRGKFAFNRHLFRETKTSLKNFVTAADRFEGEELVNGNISLTLSYGYNYLGNPFMVPLDLSGLLTASRTDWGINTTDVAQQYYVLTKGATGSSSDGGQTFSFTSSFLVGQTEGSTALGHRVAPMQLFVVKNNGAAISGFTIPYNKRSHGTSQFLRSASVYEPIDELLLEARDKTTGGFDRMCVVFRGGASLKATDQYDAEKLFNRTGGVSQLYTRSEDGKELTTTVIPPNTYRLPLYFEPSLEAQQVDLEASRLESLQSVYDVEIEDTKVGTRNSFFRNPVYSFISTPGDSPTRFVLHFTSNPTGTEEIANAKLSARYQNGVVYLDGLQRSEAAGEVRIYNVQGQLMAKEKVSNTSMQLYRKLDRGLYFINQGNRSVKLLVKN